MFYVYILRSQNKKWYYVGSTNRVDERLTEHNSGGVRSTKAYRPFTVVYTKEFQIEIEARRYERKLKDCRIEKERIIRSLKNS